MVYAKQLKNDQILVYEKGQTSYVEFTYDENGAIVSVVKDENQEIIEVIAKDNKGNVTVKGLRGNLLQFIAAKDIGTGPDENIALRATQFSSTIGQKTNAISKNISFKSMMTNAGRFIGVASLIGVLATAVGTLVTLSSKIVNIVTGIVSMVASEGANYAKGGIRFTGPKVCRRKRGGSNSYNAYVFEPTSAVRY